MCIRRVNKNMLQNRFEIRLAAALLATLMALLGAGCGKPAEDAAQQPTAPSAVEAQQDKMVPLNKAATTTTKPMSATNVAPSESLRSLKGQ